MENRPLQVSLRLDAGELDHFAPLLGFVCDHLGELSRRSRQRLAAEVSETGLHLGVVEGRVDLLVEFLDDLGRLETRGLVAWGPGAELYGRKWLGKQSPGRNARGFKWRNCLEGGNHLQTSQPYPKARDAQSGKTLTS